MKIHLLLETSYNLLETKRKTFVLNKKNYSILGKTFHEIEQNSDVFSPKMTN